MSKPALDELERQILEELEKQTPWNVIAQKYHVSSKTIDEIKKRHSSSQVSVGEAETAAKAFQLFETAKSPVQVTIELRQYPELILKLYNLWMSMNESSKKLNEKMNESYRRGYDDAMKIQHFKAPCSICGSLGDFSSTDPEWKTAIRPRLNKAFSDYRHVECIR